MKDKIQQELDNNRLWTVQYGFIIVLLVIAFSLLILYLLKIEDVSVIYWVYKNYLK